MGKIKKFTALVLCLILLLSSSAMLIGCAKDDPEEVKIPEMQVHTLGAVYPEAGYMDVNSKKAMIIIPGLMASQLYEDYTLEDGKPIEAWGYGFFIDLVTSLLDVKDGTTEEKHAFFEAAINSLACDENNVPINKLRVSTMDDVNAFDAFGGCEYIYDILQPLYGNQYDIFCWQYDWRQHNMGAAEQLEKFINGCGYEEVMFYTHSMGGIVVANYLSRSQENRDKVKLFMPFGAPFLGSMDAITNLFTWLPDPNAPEIDWEYYSNNLVSVVTALMGGEDLGLNLFDFAVGLVNYMLEVDFSLADLARTIASVYELLPFDQYFNTQYFDEAKTETIMIDGIPVSAYVNKNSALYKDGEAFTGTSFQSYMAAFDWAKKENGENQPAIANLVSYRDKFFFEKDGKTVFVTELVPTEYIVGVGKSTTVAVDLTADGQIKEVYKSLLGDNTVPAYSASAGLSLTHERVHLVYGVEHGPLMNNDEANPTEKTGLRYVADILDKYIEYTDAELAAR